MPEHEPADDDDAIIIDIERRIREITDRAEAALADKTKKFSKIEVDFLRSALRAGRQYWADKALGAALDSWPEPEPPDQAYTRCWDKIFGYRR